MHIYQWARLVMAEVMLTRVLTILLEARMHNSTLGSICVRLLTLERELTLIKTSLEEVTQEGHSNMQPEVTNPVMLARAVANQAGHV